MNANPGYDIIAYGESGWLARFKDGGDPVALALFANAAAALLREQDGVLDAVAGLDSLVVRFAPQRMTAEAARSALENAIAAARLAPGQSAGKRIDIPVCYGGVYGPDFDKLCAQINISATALIEAHAGKAYTVMTVGFAPGFAYMGPLDKRLEAPRLATPRAHVPKGSVGVAGGFTGVYPLPSPGGWRIIGRTPIELFNPQNAEPFAFSPGDEVRFTPVAEEAFESLRTARS